VDGPPLPPSTPPGGSGFRVGCDYVVRAALLFVVFLAACGGSTVALGLPEGEKLPEREFEDVVFTSEEEH